MNDIRKKLLELSDEDYKKFNEKLCPDTKKEMLGIKIPELRKLAKEIIKQYDINYILDSLKEEYFEEVIVKGLCIAYYPISFEEKIPYIKKFIPLVDSWAISDTFIPTLKLKNKDLNSAWDLIISYTISKKEFDVRCAVIMMLDYFIVDAYVDRVILELDKISHEGYYVKMSVAWCLAEIRNKI